MYNQQLTRVLKTFAIATVLSLVVAGCGVAGGPTGQAGPTQPPAEPPTTAPTDAAPTSPATASPGASGEVSPDALEGTKWTLISYGPVGSPTEVPADAGVTAEFAEGQVRGSTGCNSYGGDYTIEGQALTVGPVVQTERACIEEERMAREREFVAALQSAQSIALDGDTLTIAYDGGELRFTKQALPADTPLEGTAWQLVAFETNGASQPPLEGMQITAQFDTGKVGGSTGCNSYGGDYTVEGATITITEIVQTLIGCEPAVQSQETAYTEALRAATSYQIDGDTLTIAYDGGALRFTKLEPAPDQPLEGTAWQLTTFVTGEVARSLISDTQITAEFSKGKVGGTAGCNQYFGSYALSDGTISFSEIGSTKKACSGEIMAQEQEFLKALGEATAYTIEAGQLTIDHASGQLVFTAAGARP